jgi:acetolactate synthase-1/2/3 large subunit
MNGAESLVRTLVDNDVTVCFSNPGTSEMHFVAALDKVEGMRCVLGLFEGVVTGAADGYYRMTGNPASTLLHLGPGLGNGLANLHNAKKARSGIVNIVGEHASYHIKHDAPLTSDIEGVARPMSDWVKTSRSAETVAADGALAVEAARAAPGHIATLILPADTAWEKAGAVATARAPAPRTTVAAEAIAAAARALTSNEPAMLMLGGIAVRGRALELAGRIAAKTGCRLMSEYNNARMECGAGRVRVDRLPYVVDNALAALKGVRQMILVGAKSPVSFFAYPGKPSVLVPDGCAVTRLATVAEDIEAALEALAAELNALTTPPAGVMSLNRPALPTGAVTLDGIAQLIATLMPDNAVIVDEAVTTGRNFGAHMHSAPPHDWLNLMGGAIGAGLPLATGRCDWRAATPGHRARRRRQRHVYAAGAVDDGAREPESDGGRLCQPLLPHPARRAGERGRGHAGPQGQRHTHARPAQPRLDRASSRLRRRCGARDEPRRTRASIQARAVGAWALFN